MTTKRKNSGPRRTSLAGLLCSLAAAVSAADPGQPDVTCEENVVRTDARSVDRGALVEAIADACGLRLLRNAEVAGSVRLPANALPLLEAVDAALADSSYQLHVTTREGPRRGMLWIFSAGDALPPEAGVLFETILLDGDTAQRRHAVRQLRRIGNDEALKLLAVALADPDSRIRRAAEEALAAIGGDEALAALGSAAAGGTAPSRIGAAEALSTAEGESAVHYLALSMSDPDPRVRAATVHSLGNVDSAASRQLLRRALEDPDESVRDTAHAVLEELDEEALFHMRYPAE